MQPNLELMGKLCLSQFSVLLCVLTEINRRVKMFQAPNVGVGGKDFGGREKPDIDLVYGKLNKRQKKTIQAIGRWVDGSCTHSKAKKTNEQLKLMGIVVFIEDAVVLTELGRSIYNELDT